MSRGTLAEVDRALLAAASADARAAADDAEVVVEVASSTEALETLQGLQEQIWGPAVVVPRNVLRAIAMAGETLLLAREGNVALGFALGIVGTAQGLHLHSHQVGVAALGRGRGIGTALKYAQRVRALEAGVTEMRWTYDPLLASNAVFNLTKLRARVLTFLPNCYGARTDAFNTGEVTDRLKVSWDLCGPPTTAMPSGVGPALVERREGLPVRSTSLIVPGARLEIPADYLALREQAREEADAWRRVVGATLAEVEAAGATLAGFDGRSYVVAEEGS